jgi:large subunit ribosomal protein L23
MNVFSVLIRPVMSEKSLSDRENLNKYTFIVDRRSTKYQVKSAVEAAFDGVQVEKVNTTLVAGKYGRRGAKVFKTAAKKKAIVTLKDGQKIKIFEDQ